MKAIKMNKTAILIITAIFLGIFFTAISFAESLKIGTEAPSFEVKSGNDKILTLDMIKGKVTVIFYETKGVVEKNRKLKDELNKFYDEQPDAIKELIVKLPFINCSSAFWPFTGIWKSKLRENSKKEGMTIYGDWDGKMFSDYKMKDKESNVVIIDKKGIIRYFVSGKVEDKEINEIKELLKEIGNEK
jgi:alkyl hydroperoxide reductase subunit AhpC